MGCSNVGQFLNIFYFSDFVYSSYIDTNFTMEVTTAVYRNSIVTLPSPEDLNVETTKVAVRLMTKIVPTTIVKSNTSAKIQK